MLKFKDFCTCKSSGRGIFLRIDVFNSIDSFILTKLLPTQVPKWSFATPVSTSKNTTRFLSTPAQNKFLALVTGETSEYPFCTSTNNDNLVCLNKKFEPYEKSNSQTKEDIHHHLNSLSSVTNVSIKSYLSKP